MSTNAKSYFKYCLVPCCTNTSITAPDKIFLCVPKHKRKREEWIQAMKRDPNKNPALSVKTTHWCCEDHFWLEEDLENYWQWKLMGNVQKFKLKDGVVPHRFECQNEDSSSSEKYRPFRRKHIERIQAAPPPVEPFSFCGYTQPSKSDEEFEK